MRYMFDQILYTCNFHFTKWKSSILIVIYVLVYCNIKSVLKRQSTSTPRQWQYLWEAIRCFLILCKINTMTIQFNTLHDSQKNGSVQNNNFLRYLYIFHFLNASITEKFLVSGSLVAIYIQLTHPIILTLINRVHPKLIAVLVIII